MSYTGNQQSGISTTDDMSSQSSIDTILSPFFVFGPNHSDKPFVYWSIHLDSNVSNNTTLLEDTAEFRGLTYHLLISKPALAISHTRAQVASCFSSLLLNLPKIIVIACHLMASQKFIVNFRLFQLVP